MTKQFHAMGKSLEDKEDKMDGDVIDPLREKHLMRESTGGTRLPDEPPFSRGILYPRPGFLSLKAHLNLSMTVQAS